MSATPGEGEGMNGLLAGTASVILRRQGADLFLRVYRSLVGVCDRYGEVRVEHSARYHSDSLTLRSESHGVKRVLDS